MEVKQIKGCIVFDIDDTLFRADPSVIRIYKKFPDGHEEALTTSEFATDLDARDKGKSSGVTFSYRDFNDPDKILKSIEQGTPLIKNLKIMDNYVNRGWDVAFLTARGQEDLLFKILSDKLLVRNAEGKLVNIGARLNREFCSAINDEFKIYPGATDSEKKANVLKHICNRYPRVIFVDDDQKNLKAASELNLPNLKMVKAWNESLDLD